MYGNSLGILTLDKNKKFSFNKMIMDIQPAVLNNAANRALSVDEAESMRAQYIRNNIPDLV